MSEEKARAAARALTKSEARFAKIERELYLHRWMLGTLIVMVGGIVLRIFGIV